MIQDFHGKSDGVSGSGKSRRHRNPCTVESSRDAKLLKEATEIAASIGRKFKYPGRRWRSIEHLYEHWLQARMQRDCERLVTFCFPKVKSVTHEIHVTQKQRRLR